MSHWPVQPLSDTAEVRLGRQRAPKNHHGESMRPYLRAANVTWDGLDLGDVKTMNFSDVEMGTYRLEPGDILLSEASGSAGEVGKPALWSGEIDECAFQNTLLRVRPREHEPKFLLHFLRWQAMSGRFVEHSRGVGIHHLGRARLASWPTPVPPLDEQRRIVAVLEDLLSRLDAAEREVARADAKLDALWRSALVATRRSLSGAPSRALGQIASTSLGKMLDAKKQSGVPVPYLRNINVRWGAFDLADLQTTLLEPGEIAKFDVRDGDVLACEGGEPGRCAVWSGDGSGIAFQKAIHRIRVNDRSDVLPEFVAAMLEEFVRAGRANRLLTGTTIKHLPQEKLRRIEIPVPSVHDQRAALDRLGRVAEEGSRFRASLVGTAQRSELLRRSVLATAFSGSPIGSPTDLLAVEEMMLA